jgi:fucose permease
MFFLGITAGRFICGAIAERASEVVLIRIGSITILAGVVGLIAPLPVIVTQLSLVLIGLGCAPIYPNTIQLTPRRFGRQASPTIIGLSMATAYTGMTLVPFLIGVVVSSYSFSYFPIILIVISLTMLVMTERLASLSTQTSVIDSLKQAQ